MSLYPLKKSTNRARLSVYDLETTTDLARVYLCGYYDGTEYRYWESKPLPPEDPNSALALFGCWFFEQPATHKRWTFAHNGGNFDHVFLLRWLLTQSDLRVELIPVQSTILRMRVIREDGRHWDFYDSFRVLPGSLESLGQTFLGLGKTQFGGDYETLHLNPARYDYLEQDCRLLFDVLIEYRKRLEGPIGGRLSMSIAGCAMKTFQMSHLAKALKSGTEKSDEICRAAYYGGRTERFRESFESSNEKSLTLYDVNSMYPWAMTQRIPTKLIGVRDGLTGFDLDACGFVDCVIDVPETTYIPILPYRTTGKLLFPTGTLSGTWATCELRRAVECGAMILCVNKAAWFRTSHPFDSYVSHLYAFRDKKSSEWSALMDLIAKLLLNSLYGKFGSSKQRELLHIRPRLEDVIAKNMTPLDSPVNCQVFSEQVEAEADYMLPHIAAWITALSRVRLHEGLSAVPPESVYYCDTDSIVTSAELPERLIGTALGLYKAEMSGIVKAHFVAPKVYSLIDKDGREKSKAKGFSSFGHGMVTPDDIEKLSQGAALQTSRFSKARTVLRGTLGLMKGEKRMHLLSDKRIFHGNTSNPIHIEE